MTTQIKGNDTSTFGSGITVDSGTLHVDATNNRVGIGTSSPADPLEISHATTSRMKFSETTNSLSLNVGQWSAKNRIEGSGGSDLIISNYDASNPIAFYTGFGGGNAERMRIDSSGSVHVKCTATQQGVTSNARGFSFVDYGIFANYNDVALICNRTNSTGNCIQLRYNGGVVGNIVTNTSSTTYSTSSDYRIKENNVNISDGISRVKLLKPYRFNFIAEPDVVVDGFYAHEVQDIVPEAITGTKDEVDDEGNPVYQGIDQSKLVPLLTAALQEAITKIEDLEARIEALENPS